MKVTAKKIDERARRRRGPRAVTPSCGFQQVSELIYFKELDYLGPLPDEVQQKLLLLGRAGRRLDAVRGREKHLVRFLTWPAVGGSCARPGWSRRRRSRSRLGPPSGRHAARGVGPCTPTRLHAADPARLVRTLDPIGQPT